MALEANIKLPNILGIECFSSFRTVSRKSVLLPNDFATHWSPVHNGNHPYFIAREWYCVECWLCPGKRRPPHTKAMNVPLLWKTPDATMKYAQ